MNTPGTNKIGGRYSQPPIYANNMTDNHVKQRYDFIPIDYMCCEIIGIDKDRLLNDPKLIFTPVLIQGDQIHSYILEEKNIKIQVFESDRITMKGSLHKYSNEGLHNYNDFTVNAFMSALKKIKCKFGINPENMRITSMEYGYNINPPLNVDLIIDHSLKHKQSNVEIKLSNDRAKYIQFKHSDYLVKVYNKGKQYRCEDQILRIEIKQTRWDKHRENGIITMRDFIHCDKYQFIEDLISKWNQILFYDPTIQDNKRYIHYRDVLYWNELRENVSRKTYCKHVNRLKELNRDKGNDIQHMITNILLEKAYQLKGVTNYNTNEVKICKVTGIEIRNQREYSFLLSHGGLKHLINEDPEQYSRIEKKYLSQKWINADLQTKIKEVAHNIRSHYTRKMKRYNSNQLIIFST